VNSGIDQSEKQTDQAAKDLVKKFMKDAKKVDKKKAEQFPRKELGVERDLKCRASTCPSILEFVQSLGLSFEL